MTRPLLTTLALAGLVALTGCADLGYLGGNDRYGDYRRGPTYDDYGDYRRGNYDSRRIDRDAARYANEIDRYLRISNQEERAIRDILVGRTYDFLDRGGDYPFPRRGNRARSFWNQADRDIERVLDRRYREPYRYYNRYGAQRYNEYYRYRRYDDRRGWYDTRRDRRDDRYDDGRRVDRSERERARRQEDRRQDRRRADRERDRREEAQRDRAQRDRQERARRDQRERARRDQRDRARRDQRDRARRDQQEAPGTNGSAPSAIASRRSAAAPTASGTSARSAPAGRPPRAGRRTATAARTDVRTAASAAEAATTTTTSGPR